jgi:hypothetical protein
MLYGVWLMDEELVRHIKSLEAPGTNLIEWRDRNPLSVGIAAREAAMAGEITLEDARFLWVEPYSSSPEEGNGLSTPSEQ